MHDAPSVSYPVGRCRFAGAAAGAVWLLGGLVLAGWAAQAAGPGWRQGMGLGVWLAAGLLAAMAWRRSPRGSLVWDGGRWSWAGVPQSSPPRVAVDLQRWMLLQLACGSARWIWLERDRDPQHWDALRRAVYSRASTQAPQGPQPPVAPT